MLLPAGTRRLYTICIQLAVGSSLWGYNIGILASILASPGWRDALSSPTPAEKGLVTSLYYLGTFVSYVFVSHPLADFLGRRYAALVGTCVLALGALLMAASHGSQALSIMILGRCLSGLGVGVVSTGIPLYQSEVSPSAERGKFVTMNHVGFITGMATGLWAGFGVTFWKSSVGNFWGWRVLILAQLLPAAIFAARLPCLPES